MRLARDERRHLRVVLLVRAVDPVHDQAGVRVLDGHEVLEDRAAHVEPGLHAQRGEDALLVAEEVVLDDVAREVVAERAAQDAVDVHDVAQGEDHVVDRAHGHVDRLLKVRRPKPDVVDLHGVPRRNEERAGVVAHQLRRREAVHLDSVFDDGRSRGGPDVVAAADVLDALARHAVGHEHEGAGRPAAAARVVHHGGAGRHRARDRRGGVGGLRRGAGGCGGRRHAGGGGRRQAEPGAHQVVVDVLRRAGAADLGVLVLEVGRALVGVLAERLR